MLKRLLLFTISTVLLVAMISCSDDNPTGSSNQPPNRPIIFPSTGTPADGATEAPLNSVLRWICTDPNGDPLTYTVYLGKTSPPAFAAGPLTIASFDPDTLEPEQTYYWQIVAEDDEKATATSPVWSFTTFDGIIPEVVSKPDPPIGPTNGETGQSIIFSTGNADNNFAHPVEYRFDWGASVFSDWSADTSLAHVWLVAGTWNVKAQARCVIHPDIISGWADAPNDLIIVSPTETISVPNAPTGPTNGETNTNLDFLASGAASSVGHALDYRFNWGDGNVSQWSQSVGKSYSWSTPGTYNVAVQARCAIDTLIESSLSASITVTIVTSTLETISTPDPPTGLDSADIGVNMTYTTTGAISSEAHEVEYSFYFRDDSVGTITGYSSQTSVTYAWYASGSNRVQVRARCKIHPAIVSAWSNAFFVTVPEPPETLESPLTPTGPTDVMTVTPLTYTTGGAISNLGHTIEYRFNFTTSGGSNIGSTTWSELTSQDYTFSTPGTFYCTAEARCLIDNEITSESVGQLGPITVGTK